MSLAVIHAGSKFLVFILDSALRSLLLACFLAATLGVFRVRTVHVKLYIWRGVLLVAIAMPALMLLSPAVLVPVPSFSRSAVAAPVQPAQLVLASASVQPLYHEDARIVRQSDAVAPNVKLSLPETAMPGFSLPRITRSVPWQLGAFWLYSTGALFFLLRILIGLYFSRRLRLGSQSIDDATALNNLWAESRACGLRRAPRLAESDLVSVPVTLGIRNPIILFPASWRTWEPDELSAVLAHELSHVCRCDSLIQLFALIHRAMFWFSPLSWWMERHLAGLAEQASDEAALSGGADRTRYAQALVGFLADLEASPARVWWHGVAMAATGDGEKRIDRILEWKSSTSGGISKSLVVALIAICLPAVAISAAAHPVAYRAQEVAAPPSPPAPPPPQQLTPRPDVFLAPAPAPVAVPVTPPAPPPTYSQPAQAPIAPPQVWLAAPAPPLPTPSQAASPTPPPPVAIEPPSINSGTYGPNFGSVGDFHWPWGPRFVIVTRSSGHLIMSASEEDAEHARGLRSKIPGDFIWFEHDGKSYIIRDQAIIDRAKQIWAQRPDSRKLQQQLQAKQQELSKEMSEQVQQRMEEIRIKIPDMTAEMQKLQTEIKDLNAKGATMDELGDLQRELGEMQRALGEARWNSNMQEINRRAAEIGRQMGELGRQIGELARQGIEQARQSSDQMRQLFNDAIARGLAKPE